MSKLKYATWCLLVAAQVAGCHRGAGSLNRSASSRQRQLFTLDRISPEEGQAYLAKLGGGEVRILPDRNALLVTGSLDQLRNSAAVLALVDGEDEYVIEPLGPLSAARNLPTNEQIARALGDVSIGTFANPPPPGAKARAIIDIHGDSVVAVVPSHLQREMVVLARLGLEGLQGTKGRVALAEHVGGEDGDSGEWESERNTTPIEPVVNADAVVPADVPGSDLSRVTSMKPSALADSSQSPRDAAQVGQSPPRKRDYSDVHGQPAGTTRRAESGVFAADLGDRPTSLADTGTPLQSRLTMPDITVPSSTAVAAPRAASSISRPPALENGEDTLVLDVPEQMDLTLLLDLAGEYLNLDYMYDPAQIRGQTVTLKLRGKLQGEMKVKELYPLLESVLKFKGFAMARHEGNLVTVVPANEALDVDPELLDSEDGMIQPGDMVVTRVLELQHVDALTAVSLLETMKLAVPVSALSETQTLIVTCYAHRMSRIERLLAIIDRPGRLRRVRFRQLQYITANMLAEKTRTLAAEFETAGVAIALTPQTSSQSAGASPQSASAQIERYLASRRENRPADETAPDRQTVYLDADDRTNRILVIGYDEQLGMVEQLIDAFDVPQQTLRTLQVYELAWVEAGAVRGSLEELDIIDGTTMLRGLPTPAAQPAVQGSPFKAAEEATPGGQLVEKPNVVVLEGANALLVNATHEQHHQLAEVVAYVDRAQRDPRTLKVYDIEHIDAGEAKNKLTELRICGISEDPDDGSHDVPNGAPAQVTGSSGGAVATRLAGIQTRPESSFGETRVVVLETGNSLLVNATAEHHEEIAAALQSIDREVRQEQMPYRIYPLENSSPAHLATVLEGLIQERAPEQDEEGKILETPVQKRREEEITIVADPNTYSLIVYASKENQTWIEELVTQLDKRRPQVLIDVTLVEITETDSFSYELGLIRGWDDLAGTSDVSGIDPNGNVMGTLLHSAGGTLTAFYGDNQIQALLTAVQSKNYGRVLAKPKLLVNDNESGTIKTTDTTYVETTKSIPVTSGGAGNQQNLIETSLEYAPYEAGITLDITPHISEGDLLRLDLSLTRSDFLPTEDKAKPPNTTASQVGTAVTVPDGSTIILGGLLRLNQNKGGKKVPLLGDIPVVGGLFRSISNSDKQSKLYVFVKAEIIRPAEEGDQGMADLERISERNRTALEKHELEFQGYQDWPGIDSKPVGPVKVLEAQ